ncbi:MAG: hypothetical protein HC837_17015 [Chloroflexaceae bacterium]|nr:hypothetical protein [Chloroflexaceae bacterium]
MGGNGLDIVATGAQALQLLAPPPFLPTNQPAEQTERALLARYRLQIFLIISYLIAVGFLAGAGFSQLYLTHATFGADPWSDYLGLLAWGFGAEASRAAVVDLVRGWKLPGIRRPA